MRTTATWRLTALTLCLWVPYSNAIDDGNAATPVLGWSTYNAFFRNYNETDLYQTADLLVNLGLAELGYTYLNVDGVWWNGDYENGVVYRNASGHWVEPTDKFPSGVLALSDYVHSKNLKLGWYTSARKTACCCGKTKMRPMSQGYEQQDFERIREWGVDYFKVDNCGRPEGKTTEQVMQLWSSLIRDTGIILENCRVGCMSKTNRRGKLVHPRRNRVEGWCDDFAHQWRISKDIGKYVFNQDELDGVRVASWDSIMFNAMATRGIENRAGPGHWLHLDTLDVGNGDLTIEENKAHFSLWCILSSPLIIGTDLSKIKTEHLDIFKNSRAIAVNQAFEDEGGHYVTAIRRVQFWAKRLPNNELAVLVLNAFNNGEVRTRFNLHQFFRRDRNSVFHILPEYHRRGAFNCDITDLWTGSVDSFSSSQVDLTLKKHEGAFFKLSNCVKVGPACNRYRPQCQQFNTRRACRARRWRRRNCEWCDVDGGQCRTKAVDTCSDSNLFAHCT